MPVKIVPLTRGVTEKGANQEDLTEAPAMTARWVSWL